MSDQLHQAKAVRVQSSAIVVAAVITTCGAVASALIQTGVSGKSNSPASGSATFAANTSAVVSSPAESAPAMQLARGQLAAANMPASLTRATTPSTQAEAETEAQSPPQAIVHTKWTVAKPELEATGSTKSMVSPWYYFSHPDGQQAAAKTKKTFDWGGVTKMFSWLN